jgi:GNAT superfamily N-acetyltransferase
VTTQAPTETPRAVSRIGSPLILASVLASTLGFVIAQFLDDLGDGILAEILGGRDVVLFNNRVTFSGGSDLAWAGGFILCLIIGTFALFVYPTQRGHGVPRLILLWTLLHVLRQALTQAAVLPFADGSGLAKAYATLDAPPGLDLVIAAGGAIGLLLIALSAASAFLAFTPHRRVVSTGKKRLVFALWIALIPAVVSAFAAIPFFLPDSEGLVLAGLPLGAVMFLATLAAAPGTTTVVGPEDERTMDWPWGLGVFLIALLIFFLGVLQGGVSIDPRSWGP